MLSLANPWWLAGLLLLPAIRWLHRTAPQSLVVTVPHVDLWRRTESAETEAGTQSSPDPAWRRRALVAALLFIALAIPTFDNASRDAQSTRRVEGTPGRLGHAERASGIVVERLAARRRIDDPDRVDLLLTATNRGSATEDREVVLDIDTADGRREVGRSRMKLDPGGKTQWTAAIPAAHSVRAGFEPDGGSSGSEGLTLDLTALRRLRIAVDPTCPAALAAAIRVHPAFVVVASAVGADAGLVCEGRALPDALPLLRFHSDGLPAPLSGPPQWSAAVPERDRALLDLGGLRTRANLRPAGGDAVLMASGGKPLLVERAGPPKRIDAAFDFGMTDAASDPGVPLVVNFAFERLLGRPLLDATASIDRQPGLSGSVSASGVGSANVATADRDLAAGHRMSRALLAAAIAVLLWELATLARRALHAPPPSDAPRFERR